MPIQNYFREFTKIMEDIVEVTIRFVQKLRLPFPTLSLLFGVDDDVCFATREMAAVLFLPKMQNKHHRMNTTVSIPATDINVVSKPSAVTIWLNRENLFFSSALEESVSNRQVCLLGHASFAFSALVCVSFVSAVPTLVCLTWFIVSLYFCKKGGLK